MNNKNAVRSLIKHLARTTDETEIEWLLSKLLTDGELLDVNDRVHILVLLAMGRLSQREIAQAVEVSIGKVIRGASQSKDDQTRDYFSTRFKLVPLDADTD